MDNTPLGGLDAGEVRAALLAAAAAAAGPTLAGFRANLPVENKERAGFDPVTAADRDAETAVRAVIADRYADHGIIGEEWAAKPSSGAFEWIVDPIDGTRAYICGVPVWGTLIGLLHAGRAVAGLLAQPFTDELWLGLPGETIYARAGIERPIRTSDCVDLSAARLSATTPDIFVAAGTAAAFERLKSATLQCRWGLDCYAYGLLAMGQLDLVAESALKNVDIAPLVPIVKNAGGVITDWRGGPAEAGGNCLAAATPQLHAAALECLASRSYDRR